MAKLNLDRLTDYVDRQKDEIYCVYAGIQGNWEDTSDEIYFHEFGWLDNHDACMESESGIPVAFIHYKNCDIEVFK